MANLNVNSIIFDTNVLNLASGQVATSGQVYFSNATNALHIVDSNLSSTPLATQTYVSGQITIVQNQITVISGTTTNFQPQINTLSGNLISSGNILTASISNETSSRVGSIFVISGALINSGNVLTASISNVQNNLNTTNSNLVSSGNILVASISNETSSRISADNYLQSEINTVSGLIGAPANNTYLQSEIDYLSGALINSGNILVASISNETSSRVGSIFALSGALINSGNILTASISNVQNNLNTTNSNLNSSGNILVASISNEASTRLNNDNYLQSLINITSGNLINSGNILTASVSNVQSQLNTTNSNLISSGNILVASISNETSSRVGSIFALSGSLNTTNSNLNSSGNILVASISNVLSQGISGVQTLTNKTLLAATNIIEADALSTTGASVYTSGATPPTSGQILTATSATTATWQTPAGTGITSLNGLTTATQTFATGTTGTTFGISSTGSAHTFNIPNASATASGLVTASAQTFGGAKIINFPAAGLTIQNPAATFNYTLSGSAITAARNLILPVVTQDETIATKPVVAQSTPSNPTGTTSVTGVMMGLAGAITPRVTGRVFIIISGYGANGTANDGFLAQIRYGTGTAPTNGAAATGTAVGNIVRMKGAAGGGGLTVTSFPYTCNAIVTGLTVGTAYWVDLQFGAITGGTASTSNISISMYEL